MALGLNEVNIEAEGASSVLLPSLISIRLQMKPMLCSSTGQLGIMLGFSST